MGRLNQDTWNQPPASLNVDWPTGSLSKKGPTLEEQKARMRETRAKVANAIAASGYAVPRWPEVGQQVNWNPPKPSLGDGPANVDSHPGEQSSSSTSRIPRRYQSSTADADAQSPPRYPQYHGGQSPTGPPDSPPYKFVCRSRLRLQQPQNSSPIKTWSTQGDGGLPGNIDPSIFNPSINIVELSDNVFLRPPPTAPRAMMNQMSSQDRLLRFGRARRHSETTSASNGSLDSANTCRVRCYSSATSDTHHSFEPTLAECRYRPDCAGAYDSPKSDVTYMALKTPHQTPSNSARIKPSARQVPDSPHNIGPPPGLVPHKTGDQNAASCSSERTSSEYDAKNGTWSKSRIWFSKEEQLRLRFARLQEKAHHLGWDKSPFFPETVGEYAALLAEKKAAEAKRIRKKIQQNEKATQLRQDEDAILSHRSQLIDANCLFFGDALIDVFVRTSPSMQKIELFRGLKVGDGLSTVLAMESCFNEILVDAPDSERVDWPPDAEFRSWRGSRPRPTAGTRWRSNSHRASWPFPRTNVPCRPHEHFPNNEIPYGERRMVFSPRWDWMPKFANMLPDESHIPVVEPLRTDISKLLPANLLS